MAGRGLGRDEAEKGRKLNNQSVHRDVHCRMATPNAHFSQNLLAFSTFC